MVGRFVNLFGYRRVLVGRTLALALVVALFAVVALAGWIWLLPLVLLLLGMVNALRFSAMNTLTLKDLPDDLASGGNSLLSMIMQLSMSIGVTLAGLLLGAFGQQAAAGSDMAQQTFAWTWLCMVVVIALPALVFWRVPEALSKNVDLRTRSKK